MASLMKCQQCNKENKKDSLFCAFCGTKIEPTEKPIAVEKRVSWKTVFLILSIVFIIGSAVLFVSLYPQGFSFTSAAVTAVSTYQPTCRDVQVPYSDTETYTDYESQTTTNSREIVVTSGMTPLSWGHKIPIFIQHDGDLIISASTPASQGRNNINYFFGSNDICQLDGLTPLVTAGTGSSYSRTYIGAKTSIPYCLIIVYSCPKDPTTKCDNSDFRAYYNIKLQFNDEATKTNPITKHRTVTKYRTEQKCD